MKIAVIADTHLNDKDLDNFKKFLEGNLKDVQKIIHCGDLKSYKILQALKEFKETIVVSGNNDDLNCINNLPIKSIIQIENYNIGIYHGHLGKGKNAFERAKEAFKDDTVDVVIFGHSHIPCINTENNIIYINPGSPNYKRKERMYSYVELHIQNKRICASLLFYEEPLIEK